MLTSLCFDLVLLGKAKLSARPIEKGIADIRHAYCYGFRERPYHKRRELECDTRHRVAIILWAWGLFSPRVQNSTSGVITASSQNKSSLLYNEERVQRGRSNSRTPVNPAGLNVDLDVVKGEFEQVEKGKNAKKGTR